MKTNLVQTISMATAFFLLTSQLNIYAQKDKIQEIDIREQGLVSICGQALERTCTRPVNGFQYCGIPKSISVKSGENVNIQISVQNMTKEPLSFLQDSFINLYDVAATGPDDKKLLSFREILEKKQLDGTITPDEMGSLLPINSAPRKILLEPQQEVKREYNLNQFYDFKTKGKYCIEISKKGVSSSLGKFNVEVK